MANGLLLYRKLRRKQKKSEFAWRISCVGILSSTNQRKVTSRSSEGQCVPTLWQDKFTVSSALDNSRRFYFTFHSTHTSI